MSDFLPNMWRFLARNSRLVNFLKNRLTCPGARISASANLEIRGKLTAGENLSIRDGANIIVAKHTCLVLGAGCLIGRYVELQPGTRIEIKEKTSIQDRCIILGDVQIGSRCILAPNVYISSGRHWHDLEPWQSIKDQDLIAATQPRPGIIRSMPVIIDDDCWIGVNVVIMRGIKIGKGAVIGANSVVTKDVQPYEVVAGVPAKLLKRRLEFSPRSSITHENAADLPYFYSGFDTALDQIKSNSHLGGIVAWDGFVVCLDRNAGKTLTLQAKVTVVGTGAVLSLGEQSRTVSDEWQPLKFDISGDSGNLFRFDVRGTESESVFIVKKAWID